MAIAVVSTSANSTTGGSTGLDLALTVNDANSVIFAGFTIDSLSPGGWPPTPRWDSSGANSTFSVIVSHTSSGRAIAAYYIVNPSTGTHSITFSDGGISTVVQRIAHGIVYSGVDSTTPYDTATVSQSNNPTGSSGVTSTAIPSESGDVVLGFLAVNNPSGTQSGAGGTTRMLSTGGSALGFITTEWPGAATVESTWALGSTTGNDHSYIAFNINAAAGGGAATPIFSARRSLMGVGR